MSTKSSIFYSSNTGNHVYEETLEAIYTYGKFRGYNVHGEIDWDELQEVKNEDGGIRMLFVAGTYFYHLFPEGWKIDAFVLTEFQVDEGGISFMISGEYSHTIEKLKTLGAEVESIGKDAFWEAVNYSRIPIVTYSANGPVETSKMVEDFEKLRREMVHDNPDRYDKGFGEKDPLIFDVPMKEGGESKTLYQNSNGTSTEFPT